MQRFFTVGAALALLVAPLTAQVPRPGLGVGVSLDLTPTSDFSLLGNLKFSARTVNLHFPISVGRTFRLEPMVGYAHESQKITVNGASIEASATVWRLGLGLLYQLRAHGDFQAYAGGRVGIRHRSQKASQSDPNNPPPQSVKASQSDKFIAAVFGGEFYFSPHFSLGGEAQLSYTDDGDIKTSQTPPPGPGPTQTESGSQLETGGLIVVRWYP